VTISPPVPQQPADTAATSRRRRANRDIAAPSQEPTFSVAIAVTIALAIVLELVLLLAFFVPAVGVSARLDAGRSADLHYLGWRISVNAPTLFVLVSLAGGALGGTLHAAASLTAHVASRDFGRSWTMWYLLNPLIGAALATTFLFVLQAGLDGQSAPGSGSIYGVAAAAALTGLFSRHALRKLKDIFDVAFANTGGPDRTEPAAPAAATGASADPGGTSTPDGRDTGGSR
jgi:hypothetical protein